MKNRNIFFFICAALLWSACNEVEVERPDFNVSVAKTEYAENEPITFVFSGEPDNITFWSGEPGTGATPGRNYDNRARYAAAGAVNRLNFTTNVGAGSQANNLALLVSSNFSGVMDSTSIRAATWTDITSRALLATNTTNRASGNVTLTDFQSAADSLYVAYRYSSTVSTDASKARPWTVSGFTFTNIFPDGVTYAHNTIASDARLGGFQRVSIKNNTLLWGVGGSLTFPVGVNGQKDEDWVISKAFRLFKIAPDMGASVKNTTQKIDSYVYRFAKAGTYTVTFVAFNAGLEDYKEVVKQVSITIVKP